MEKNVGHLNLVLIYLYFFGYCVVRDGSVGIATGYGLDGPGIETRWGRNFSTLSGSALRPTQPPVQWVPGLSRWQIAAGA